MKQGAALILLFFFVGIAMEAVASPKTRYDEPTDTCRNISEGRLEWESRPWGTGGKLFRAECQSCHSRNNGEDAPFLWVESKSSKAWNRVFSQRYPQCAKNGSWDTIPMEKQLVLNDYLYRWAKNSQDVNDSA